MPQVIRTDQAEQDLIDALVYIGRHSPAAAHRFAAAVDRVCQLLAQFPQMGTACERLGRGLRQFPVDSYVIFYRPIDGGIEVVRVVHGSRNMRSLFRP
jgi:toxin ParE1/3/4